MYKFSSETFYQGGKYFATVAFYTYITRWEIKQKTEAA